MYIDLHQILFQGYFFPKSFVVDFAARELVKYDKDGKDEGIRR